jgi:hypothetical protein
LLSASEKHEVVIGDAPGKITAESKEIAKHATHAMILCREARREDDSQVMWGS